MTSKQSPSLFAHRYKQKMGMTLTWPQILGLEHTNAEMDGKGN